MTEVVLDVPNNVAKEMENMPLVNWNETLLKDILRVLNEREMVESILAKSKMKEADAEEIDRIVKRDLFEKHYSA